jgi:hypothetical protein
VRLREIVLAALGCAALSSPATAQASAPWHAERRVDPDRPVALACPSRSLCIGVDVAGNVLSTTAPMRTARPWRIAGIDRGTRFWGVSCPAPTLCVAVDDAGRVLTSSHPHRSESWRRGIVRPGGLLSVSCPSTRLCVAVGGADVAFSTAPREGSRSWRLVRGVDQSLGPECGTEGPGSVCGSADLVSVSCPSASFCSASDAFGSRIRSTAPGTIRGWSRSGNSATGLADGPISCLDSFHCLTTCTSGSGSFTSQCPGYPSDEGDLETLSNARIGITQHLVAPDPLTGLWCRAAQLCFAADAAGALVASPDPTNTTSSWLPVISAPHIPDDPRTVLAVACPSSTRCLALDSAGDVHAGAPPPGYVAIRAWLRRAALAVTRGRARRRTVTFRAPLPGELSIVFHRPRQRPILAVALGSIRRAGAARLTFAPSRAGRRTLAYASSTVVTFQATFAPAHLPGAPAGHPVRLLGRARLRAR